jgi:colicin V production protein
MFISIMLILVFIACFAALMNSGLWSNTITLINVITSALLATNYFEPLADWFDTQDSRFTYVWDFFALWLIFGVSMGLLRAATDYMSPVKVKFFMPVDKGGGILLALWSSWVMVCFVTMTLHTAPLARNFLDGSFQPQPTSKMLFGTGPDRQWLGWVHRESLGSLCRWDEFVPFDRRGDFILRYGSRREEFEKQLTFTKSKESAAPAAPRALPVE